MSDFYTLIATIALILGTIGLGSVMLFGNGHKCADENCVHDASIGVSSTSLPNLRFPESG